MYWITILLVVIIIMLIVYIYYLRIFKYAFLIMCANDKNALGNLMKFLNPFENSLINRNIPLSICLNQEKVFSKFVKQNLFFGRIDDYLTN